jgi:hypothetical protein
LRTVCQDIGEQRLTFGRIGHCCLVGPFHRGLEIRIGRRFDSEQPIGPRLSSLALPKPWMHSAASSVCASM